MQFGICFIEDTGIIINKEERYEIIDECMDMETPEMAKNSQEEVTTCPKFDSTTQQDTDAGKICKAIPKFYIFQLYFLQPIITFTKCIIVIYNHNFSIIIWEIDNNFTFKTKESIDNHVKCHSIESINT